MCYPTRTPEPAPDTPRPRPTAGQGHDDQGDPMGAERATPMATTMRIPQRNPGTRGEHPTNQPPWVGAWPPATSVSPVHQVVDEFSPLVVWPPMIGLTAAPPMFFSNGEYGFTSIGSWCYSMGWVWNLRTTLCSIASVKWSVSRVLLQGFDARYIMF